MTVCTTMTITLNPATESDIIRLYEQDKGWDKLSETTTAYVFECTSPKVSMNAVYIPSKYTKGDTE